MIVIICLLKLLNLHFHSFLPHEVFALMVHSQSSSYSFFAYIICFSAERKPSSMDAIDIHNRARVEVSNLKDERSDFDLGTTKKKESQKFQKDRHQNSKNTGEEYGKNRTSIAPSTRGSNLNMLDKGGSPTSESSLTSSPVVGPAPLCRQFWNAGNYKLFQDQSKKFSYLKSKLLNIFKINTTYFFMFCFQFHGLSQYLYSFPEWRTICSLVLYLYLPNYLHDYICCLNKPVNWLVQIFSVDQQLFSVA